MFLAITLYQYNVEQSISAFSNISSVCGATYQKRRGLNMNETSLY